MEQKISKIRTYLTWLSIVQNQSSPHKTFIHDHDIPRITCQECLQLFLLKKKVLLNSNEGSLTK